MKNKDFLDSLKSYNELNYACATLVQPKSARNAATHAFLATFPLNLNERKSPHLLNRVEQCLKKALSML